MVTIILGSTCFSRNERENDPFYCLLTLFPYLYDIKITVSPFLFLGISFSFLSSFHFQETTSFPLPRLAHYNYIVSKSLGRSHGEEQQQAAQPQPLQNQQAPKLLLQNKKITTSILIEKPEASEIRVQGSPRPPITQNKAVDFSQ